MTAGDIAVVRHLPKLLSVLSFHHAQQIQARLFFFCINARCLFYIFNLYDFNHSSYCVSLTILAVLPYGLPRTVRIRRL